MVEELPPLPERHENRGPHWLRRLVLGVLGLSAVFRLLTGLLSGRQRQPPPEPADIPPQSAEEEIHYPDGRIEHPAVRYEHRDASFRGVALVLIGLMCVASFHFYMVLWFYHRYAGYEAAIKRSPFPLAAEPSEQLPRSPRLEQVDRLANIKSPDVSLREGVREQVLQSYGATSEKGFVHIPIDRAMELLANKLPARKGQPAKPPRDNGLVDSGASNSGRMFRKEGPWFEH
jgi:hypothetical protein